MAHLRSSTALRHIHKADQVAVDVGQRILKRMPYSSLRRQVHYRLVAAVTKHPFCELGVGEIETLKGKARFGHKARQTRALKPRIVIIVEVVDSVNQMAIRQKAPRQMEPDKTGHAGNKDLHIADLSLGVAPHTRSSRAATAERRMFAVLDAPSISNAKGACRPASIRTILSASRSGASVSG